MGQREQVVGADLFRESSQRIVDYLNAHTPIPNWSVSRVAGGVQVHLHVHPEGVLSAGMRVPWQDSFCVRMANGANRFVADTLDDPDYADHPDARTVRSYAGFPIVDDEGNAFGTLCGIGIEPLAAISEADIELISLMGALLSTQVALARAADRARRAAEIAEALAHTDALTGLTNRRGWDLLLEDAAQRVESYGDLVAVAVIDLDGLKHVNDTEGHEAGDDLLRRAATALATVGQEVDRVARFGGDEFAVLSNNVTEQQMPSHFGRFLTALADEDIAASMGYAATHPGSISTAKAFAKADADMYASKQARRGT